MHTGVLTAKALADRVNAVDSGARLAQTVAEFAHSIEMVPREQAKFTAADHEMLARLADVVIDRVEEHLATAPDRASILQELAASIYGIRRRMEDIYLWQRYAERTGQSHSGGAS